MVAITRLGIAPWIFVPALTRTVAAQPSDNDAPGNGLFKRDNGDQFAERDAVNDLAERGLDITVRDLLTEMRKRGKTPKPGPPVPKPGSKRSRRSTQLEPFSKRGKTPKPGPPVPKPGPKRSRRSTQLEPFSKRGKTPKPGPPVPKPGPKRSRRSTHAGVIQQMR
jgi:hypothetical protein